MVREAAGNVQKGQIKKGPDSHKTESGFLSYSHWGAYNWMRQIEDFFKTGKNKIQCKERLRSGLEVGMNYGQWKKAPLSLKTGWT